MNEAKRHFLLMFALSIVFAGLAGFLFLQKLQSLDRQYGERVPVVVAKQSIPPKTPITPDMLDIIELPGQFELPSAIRAPAEAAGHISLIPIQKGDFMTKTMLKKIPATGDSLRLVNLTQSERVLFDEPLDATDHVDIVVSLQEGEKPVTKLLLENVPIGRVLSDKERQWAIGVELSLEDAQKLIFMQNFSRQIRVLKHPAGVR